ncbi:MAG: GNAT family N-acetyltransferase [Anaerolineae bacterium]|nr:GNAT family N-acetyltransferase [Anaerolineae bacterium]
MNLTYRRITFDDAATVTYHRRSMYEAMGNTDPAILDPMEANFIGWVKRRLEDGTYLGWFCLDGEKIVAGVGIWLQDWPPHVLDPQGPRAYILNVFVEPEYRQQGIARELTQHCIDWSREQGIKVITLHYSDAGKFVYEKLGFQESNEMRLRLG